MPAIDSQITSLPIPVLKLKISTDICIDSRFLEDPVLFSREHQIRLIGEVLPETSFRKTPGSIERAAKVNANIHLVQSEAICLFIKNDGDGARIRSIRLNPSLLLYGDETHPLTWRDLLLAFSMLVNEVAPLLASPSDRCHILPGLARDDKHVAYWSSLKCGMELHGIHLSELHNLVHPVAGPAEGTTKERMQLGKNDGDLIIRLERSPSGRAGGQDTQSLRAMILLKGQELPTGFRGCGLICSINNAPRLITFTPEGLAGIYYRQLARMEGIHLPRPQWWAKVERPVKAARVILILSAVTSIPRDELARSYVACGNPSPSTLTRLRKAIRTEAGHLRPVPVSTLFPEKFQPDRTAVYDRPAEGPIDPEVLGIYGGLL